MAQPRTAAGRPVERAQSIWRASQGWRVPASARDVGLNEDPVRRWLTRVNAAGLAGLHERPRAGRPAPSTAEPAGDVVARALTDPQRLGLPVASWTLDRRTADLHEVKRLPMSRARIGQLLVAAG